MGDKQVTGKAGFRIPDAGMCLFLSQPPWSEQPNSEKDSRFIATAISISSSHTFLASLITASGGWDVFLVPVADVQSFTFFFFSLGHLFIQTLVIQGAA